VSRVLFAHDHERGFAFEVHVGVAADVDRYPVDGAAGEVDGAAGEGAGMSTSAPMTNDRPYLVPLVPASSLTVVRVAR